MSKKAKYPCKFQDSWPKTYSFIVRVKEDKNSALCTHCKVTFSIGAGGKNDITRHSNSEKHKNHVKMLKESQRISDHFAVGNAEIDQITTSEGLFAMFVSKHNIAFNVADHFTKLMPIMFPDSKVAAKFSCARTKTSSMVKEVLGPQQDEVLTHTLRNQKFALLVDESTDKNTDKMLAILARVYDKDGIYTKFIDMPICNIGTAEHIFSTIDQCFRKREIPWSNVFAFNSDNCSVMKGIRGGLIAKLRAVSPNIIDVGCVCHLANLAVGAALKVLPIPVDDLVTDIFHHFCLSSKRCETLKEFQQFVGAEESKILKHCPTRWLSLRRCLQRIIQQYDALKSYFTSHPDSEKPRSKVGHIYKLLADPFTLPWLHFLVYSLEPYYQFNLKYQSEEVLIVDLYQSMTRLIKKVMACYISMESIRSANTLQECDRSVHVSDLDLNLGTACRTLLTPLEESESPDDVHSFYSDVRKFCEAGVAKMLKIFPLASSTLKMAPAANPGNSDQYSAAQICELAQSFSFTDVVMLDKVASEWIEYQLEDVDASTNVADYWCSSRTKDLFPNLCEVMRVLLSIPHSNASSERVFSMLKKIVTDHRSLLAPETVVALLRIKLNESNCCINTNFTKDTVRHLKRAAMSYNSKHTGDKGAEGETPSTSTRVTPETVTLD